MGDVTSQEVLCRWAERRFKLSNVSNVQFDPRYVEGCPTCGGDTFLEVYVTHGDRNKCCSYEIDYTTDLINEIVNEALAR